MSRLSFAGLLPVLLLAACSAPAPAPLGGLSVPVRLTEVDDPVAWSYGAVDVQFYTLGQPHNFQDRGTQLLATVHTDAQGHATLDLPGEAGLSGFATRPAAQALDAVADWYKCPAPILNSSDPASRVVVGAIGRVKFKDFDSPVWPTTTGNRQYDLLLYATRASQLTGSLNCGSQQAVSVALDAGWNVVRYADITGVPAFRRVAPGDLLPFEDD